MDLLGKSFNTRCPGRESIPLGGFMNILAALTQEEAKLKKQADKVRQQLNAVRAATKILGP